MQSQKTEIRFPPRIVTPYSQIITFLILMSPIVIQKNTIFLNKFSGESIIIQFSIFSKRFCENQWLIFRNPRFLFIFLQGSSIKVELHFFAIPKFYHWLVFFLHVHHFKK